MNPNFIHILLCNNDYAWSLEQAAKQLFGAVGKEDILVSEWRIKEVVVDLMVALDNLSAAAKGFESPPKALRNYFEISLRVVFSKHAPTQDHDGGSVAINRYTGLIWRF